MHPRIRRHENLWMSVLCILYKHSSMIDAIMSVDEDRKKIQKKEYQDLYR